MAGQRDAVDAGGFDFLQDDIKYKRSGGCFVTTKKAIIYLIIAILASVLVGVFLYYYGPTDHSFKVTAAKSEDIEKLLNDSLESIPIQDVRLSTSVRPLHYRLKLHPVIDAYQPNRFTFSGRVSIVIQCVTETKEITLNSVNLEVGGVELRGSHSQQTPIRTSRSIPDDIQMETGQNNSHSSTQPSTVETTKPTPVSHILVLTTGKSARQEVSPMNNNATITNILETARRETDELKTSVVPPPTTSQTVTETTTKPSNTALNGNQRLDDLDLREKFAIASTTEDKKDFKYTIHLSDALKVGNNYTLVIDFSGTITNNIKGLYTPSYVDANGEKRWILSTNFEPMFAREAFPCFDEPAFKATFEISLARRTNMTAIANTPIKATEAMNETGWVWDHFRVTPPMPTYLVAFAVLDFESKTTDTMAEPLFKVWAPNNKIGNAGYALDTAAKILKFYEKYFGLSYSLPKIDFVAIPDLPKDTMQGWGLIFFRDTSLLLNSNASDFDTKRVIFNAIAEELAQQWFGSLVTLNWWDDIWLNEGFAMFLAEEAEKSIEDWIPDFTLRITQYMLNNDDFKSSHSLRINITNTLQVNALLDSVVHYKGSCLLRMLNYSLSENTFRAGIQNYLRKRAGGAANATDLWRSITQSVTNKNDLPHNYTVEGIMASWTRQTGYPLVTIGRDYITNSINISQTRFQVLNNSDDSLWIIPLNYMVGSNNSGDGVGKLWLTNRSITLNNINDATNNTWVLFNVEQTGYYRVNYDNQNWKLLEESLKANPNSIPVLNRAELLNDAFELAENGILDYKVPFELAQYLSKERSYVPWSSVLNSLDLLHNILHPTYLNGAYEDYVINLVASLYDEMGPTEKENESPNDKLLRTLIVKTACSVRYQPCVDWAQSQFRAWMKSSSPYIQIPYNIRQAVLCTAIEMGGENEWDFLWIKINPSMTSSDTEDAYMSLGCSRDVWLINRYLVYSLNGTIPWQNVPLVWQSIGHSTGISVGFKFLRENWKRIYGVYEDKVVILKSIVTNFLYGLSTPTDLEDLTLFFSNHDEDLQSLSTLIQGVVDRINARTKWSNKHMSSVASWLTSNNYK